MIKSFPISFVQVALEQTLLKNKIKNLNLVGGKNQIEIHSFYEQLKTQNEVDRFIETFRDLTEQQNRSGLIANGILMSPENPTITNLYTSMIIPMSWACSLRVKLSDRDLMLETINELIEELKGSKVDIAELKCRDEMGRAIYVPFAVGTIGHNEGKPAIKCGDYLADMGSDNPTNAEFRTEMSHKVYQGITNGLNNGDYIYFKGADQLKVAVCDDFEDTITVNLDRYTTEIDENGNINIRVLLVSTSDIQTLPNQVIVNANVSLTDGNDTITVDKVASVENFYIQANKLNIIATFNGVASVDDFTPTTTTIAGIEDIGFRSTSQYILADINFTSNNDFLVLPPYVDVSYDIDFYANNPFGDSETNNITGTTRITNLSLKEGKITFKQTMSTGFYTVFRNPSYLKNSYVVTAETLGTLTFTINSTNIKTITNLFRVVEDDGSFDNVIFPPEHESFEKYKLSLSFEGLRCDTPRTLNGDEYCEISFGGSATLVNYGVKLGNDLIKVSMKKNKILAETPIVFYDAETYYLEPLELPSGNGANTIPNQLVSNAFKVNTHSDSLTITLQYTFIADETQPILKQLFDYGRYGTTGITEVDISPNIIYDMTEWWSSWGVVNKMPYLGKIVESVDIENTESDTLTLSLTMQVQGENN